MLIGCRQVVVGGATVDGPRQSHHVAASCEREGRLRAVRRRVTDSGGKGSKCRHMVSPWHAHAARKSGRLSHRSSVAQRCGRVLRPVLSPNGVATTGVSRPPVGGETFVCAPAIRPDHGPARRGGCERSALLSRPRNRVVRHDGRVPRVAWVLLCEWMSPLPVRAGLVN